MVGRNRGQAALVEVKAQMDASAAAVGGAGDFSQGRSIVNDSRLTWFAAADGFSICSSSAKYLAEGLGAYCGFAKIPACKRWASPTDDCEEGQTDAAALSTATKIFRNEADARAFAGFCDQESQQ